MVPSVTAILQRFTTEWATLLQHEALLSVCREIGYTTWRDRVLTPVTTIQVFLLQVLHGNTACSHLPHLSGFQVQCGSILPSPRKATTALLRPAPGALRDRCAAVHFG